MAVAQVHGINATSGTQLLLQVHRKTGHTGASVPRFPALQPHLSFVQRVPGPEGHGDPHVPLRSDIRLWAPFRSFLSFMMTSCWDRISFWAVSSSSLKPTGRAQSDQLSLRGVCWVPERKRPSRCRVGYWPQLGHSDCTAVSHSPKHIHSGPFFREYVRTRRIRLGRVWGRNAPCRRRWPWAGLVGFIVISPGPDNIPSSWVP